MTGNVFRTLRFFAIGVFFASLLPGVASSAMDYRPGDPTSPYVPEYGPFAPTAATVYQPLSGTWHMQVDGNEARQVVVPGCWPAGRNAVSLNTSFRVPEELAGRHIRLVFWGARRQLSIKVNDRLVEAWESDWPTVVVDLPNGLLRTDRPNDLEIEVRDRLSARESIPLKPKLYDDQTYGGLFADVALVAGPTASLETISWKVRLQDNYRTARYDLTLGIRNERVMNADSVATRNLTVRADWTAPNGITKGSSEEVPVSLGAVEISQVTLSGKIDQPRLWSVDDPNLYTFSLVFKEGDKTWTIPLQFGLNETKWTPEGVELNGNLLKVRGIDLRQESAVHGTALTVAEIESDLQRVKKLGFNLVRIIGEPPHPATAGICDRLGLLLIPQTGLRGVPGTLFVTPAFHDRVSKMLTAMVQRDGLHPSIAAWGVTSWSPATPDVVEALRVFHDETARLDARPLLAGFASYNLPELPDGIVGVRDRSPYNLFQPLKPMKSMAQPWLLGGLGAFATRTALNEDSVRGQVRQSDAVLHNLKAARSMPVAGFIIDDYADRRGAMPLMICGAEKHYNNIARGLLNESRDERISWQKVGEALGQLRIEAPTLELPKAEFPIVFPIATMIVGGILLLVMRQNNVFRQNLKRVFAHTHGFFVDIRDRRYFQTGQTFLVALIFASSQAILTASWLHHSRFDFGLDYFLTLLFPFFEVKHLLVQWAWQPLQGIAAFTVIYFVLLILIAFLIRIFSLPFHGSLRIRQSFSLVAWGSTHFVLLIPLGLIHYRFLDYTWFIYFVVGIFAVFWVWYIFRIVSIIRIGYRVTSRTAWTILIVVLLLFAGTTWALYRSGFAITDYFDYYTKVILPWVRA